MKIFCEYIPNTGEIIGFYSDEIHQSIPDNIIEVTYEEWNLILSNPEKFMIDVNNQQIIEKPIDVEKIKLQKIRLFNNHAKKELSNLDWKVLRHKEQQDLGISTSLTTQEYQELLQQKQTIRDKVNALETTVNNCLTIDEINQLYW
ncbi:MAG: hypothetical protein ACOCWG_05420 [bacterium]